MENSHCALPIDEVIAGSEDEEDSMPYFGLQRQGVSVIRQSSPISSFAACHYQSITRSTISNFTAGPSAILDQVSDIASFHGYSMKGADDSGPVSSGNGGTYTDFEPIPSIADRAKTRQRPAKPTIPTPLDIIELTDDDDDYLGEGSSKPKPKPKPKSKVKSKPKPAKDSAKTDDISSASALPASHNNNIEEDPPAPPRPRPRPRPRPCVAPQPITESLYTNPLSLKSPTHDTTHPLESSLATTNLPLPSISTAVTDDPKSRAPPIDFLSDAPLSSPNSLFGDLFGEGPPKKKRRRTPDFDELDELAPSPGSVYPVTGLYGLSPPRGMHPPATFFAGSSSSSIGREGKSVAPVETSFDFDDLQQDEPHRDMVDLRMIPPIIIPPTKANKSKKKKVDLSLYDGNAEGAMVILDEDDQDEDFNPGGEGSNNKKKKSKAKPKDKEKVKEKVSKKKGKGVVASDSSDTPGKNKLEMEVLIDARPHSKASENKESKGGSSNKEIFKSSEFVVDSDDDELGPLGAGPSGHTINVSRRPQSPNLPASNTSIQSSTPPVAPAVVLADSRFPSPLTDIEAELIEAGPSLTSHVSKSKKKRKSIVDSEGEDEDLTLEMEHTHHMSPSVTKKKRKTDHLSSVKPKNKSRSKKLQKSVITDDEQEISGNGISHDFTKTSEPSLKLNTDDQTPSEKKDLGKNNDESSQEDQRSETGNVHKENIAPTPSRATFSTPGPGANPRPSVPPSSMKTPLYLRYEIAPRKSSTPMSELIRRANSMPGSPFSTPHPPASSAQGSSSKSKSASRPAPLAYSSLLKSSRSMLSRIATLHPNRRTPPPPPPPPPPRKKSKKELELEEKWEEEMIESVGGVEAWAVLGDDERKDMRKAKWAHELGGWDE